MNTHTSPPTAPQSGSRRTNVLPVEYLLDEYRIETVLGVGGFGVTYKALDTHLNAWVAIKEYFPLEWSFRDADGVMVHPNTQGMNSASNGKISDYQWGMERFLDEARVLAQIQHPYVVQVKRYFRANGTAYIVMDYEEGQPLSAILADGETLTEEEVRGLLEDVVPALRAVHEHGYLHRDIKPANLYVRARDQRVILIDFGAARFAVSCQSQSITSLVTPGYSPPEQYTTRNDRYGTWTDIYALGAVLYRCITGHTPTEAAERLLDDHMEPALQAGAGRYSTNLLKTIDRALAVRPEQRFRDMAEMEAALEGLAAGGDETVVLAPGAKGSAATEAARTAVQRAMAADDDGDACEILPPEDMARTQGRALLPAQVNPPPAARRWSPAWLGGGAALAAAIVGLVWLWPSAPAPQPPVQATVTSPTAPVTATSSSAPTASTGSLSGSAPVADSSSSSAAPSSATASGTGAHGLVAPSDSATASASPEPPEPTEAASPASAPSSPPSSQELTAEASENPTTAPVSPESAETASSTPASPPISQEPAAAASVQPSVTSTVAPLLAPAASAAASAAARVATPAETAPPVRTGATSRTATEPVRPSATTVRGAAQKSEARAKTGRAARSDTPRKNRRKARRRETAPEPVAAPMATPPRRAAPSTGNPWDTPAASGFNNK